MLNVHSLIIELHCLIMHKLNSIVVLFGLLVLLSALVVCSVLPPPNQQMNHKLVLSLVQPNANNNLSNHKIVGGSTASYAQFPHMVSLRRNDYHFCGGSIISNRWILTAAHCLYGFSYWDILTAVVGTNTLDGFGTVYQVVQQILHEDYSPSTVLNDIALIKVHETIEFTDTVNKIALPLDSPSDNFLATFSGWGLTSYPGSIPNALQYINLLAYDLDTCAQYYHSSVFPIGMGHVCTLNTVNEGICMGDSGGPLIVNGEQIGIASWVAPCALGAPDVFTSVFHYLPWIFDQIDTL